MNRVTVPVLAAGQLAQAPLLPASALMDDGVVTSIQARIRTREFDDIPALASALLRQQVGAVREQSASLWTAPSRSAAA